MADATTPAAAVRATARSPWARLWLPVAAAAALSLVWAVLARRPWDDAAPVRLGSSPVPAASPAESSEPAEIRVAVASLLSPRRSVAAQGRLFDVLSAEMGAPIRIVQRRTYAEVNDLLIDGYALVGFVCSGAYVAAEHQGLAAIAAPVVRGTPTYRSYIIGRRDLDAAAFDDLRGRSFAFMDPLSNSGCLYPSSLLAERGIAPTDFFDRVIWTGSHEGSVEAVAHGLVDAAAVDGLTYEFLRTRDPDLVGATRVVQISPPFAISPVVVSPVASPEFCRRLREILLGLHETPAGQAALADLDIERFVEAHPEDYESIRAMRALVDSAARR